MDSIRCFYFWIPVLLVCALIWILFRCFFSFFLLRSVVSLGFYAMDRSSFGLLVLGAKGNMGAWVCVFFLFFFLFCSHFYADLVVFRYIVFAFLFFCFLLKCCFVSDVPARRVGMGSCGDFFLSGYLCVKIE